MNCTDVQCLNDTVVCSAVVMYCHTKFPVMARFLFRAQDRNMTNGDFAFFHFRPIRTHISDMPWILYVTDPADLPRRRRAFHVVKQACATVITLSTVLLL